MTTGHAPHTPPLWRRVRSLPHTRLGRWAIGLTGGSALLLSFGLFLNGDAVGVGVSPWVWMILVAGILAGALVGLIALLRSPQHAPPIPLSRRVFFVWLAMVPVALVAAVPIAFMAQFLSYEVRHDVSIVSTVVLPLVGMTAGVAALHFVQSGSERYGLGGTIYSAASLIGVALRGGRARRESLPRLAAGDQLDGSGFVGGYHRPGCPGGRHPLRESSAMVGWCGARSR
jgi:MFS family permease